MNQIRLIALIALLSLLTACNEVKPPSDMPDSSTQNVGDNDADTDYKRELEIIPVDEVKGKRYALVMGNATYQGDPYISPLTNPRHDARDMKQTLQGVGFEVVYLEDAANQLEMEAAVQAFTQKLHQGSVGLFYYAGHAMQVNGENYLIPTQVKLPSETEVKYKTMSAQYVLDKMGDANNGFNIIILDACRDNPFPKKSRGLKRMGKLAEMRSPKGSIIAFATSPNKTAKDGDGRNGIYTKHLLTGIKQPCLTLEEMFKTVRVAVWDETEGGQIPWEHSSVRDNFCFSGCQCSQASMADAIRQVQEAEKRAKEAEQRAKKAKKNQREQEEIYMPPAY